MNLVDQYISNLEDHKKEWVEQLVAFMRGNFPKLEESFERKMPIYKGKDFYVAFAAQKNYFSFYTNFTEVLPIIKEIESSTSLGKSCARINYKHTFLIDELFHLITHIIDEKISEQATTSTDIQALKVWKTVPKNIQKMILENVYCSTCGVTTIGNYNIQLNSNGLLIKGSCIHCNQSVARLVEN